MKESPSRNVRWLAALLGGAVLILVSWFGQTQGWWMFAYRWAHQRVARANASDSGKGQMDRNMPGMQMGSMRMGESSRSTGIPGYAQVAIAPDVQQRIGVTSGRVEKSPLRMSVRTVGIVQVNESVVAHVHLKTEGWLEKVFVNYTGQKVGKGDPLLAIYSPEFFATEQEFLIARQGAQSAAAHSAQSLPNAARRRLELWDVPADEIRQLERTGQPQTYLTLRSPLAGTVFKKNAFVGQHVTPQTELYVVADLSTVWVQAKVYEYELPHVAQGGPATVSFPALMDRKFNGQVVFIEPIVEGTTRTVQVRVELPNPDGLLKPGMFGNVRIEHTMGEGLLVPTSAVIRTGERDIAFRVEPNNRFVPVEVKISSFTFGDRFQVLEGLKAGDRVVTSADFLIDSESRLRIGGMAGMPGMDHGK